MGRGDSAAITEMGAGGATVAVDRFGVPAYLALTRRGIAIRDSAPVMQEARRVKTPQELSFLDVNATMVMEMLAAFEAAIEPGVSERELLAVLAGVMLRRGGEYLATNTVCSGPNTNPWRAEATERRLEPGDLVYVDTDTVGIEGMFFCVSRTFPVDGAPPVAGAARRVPGLARVAPGDGGARSGPAFTCGELRPDGTADPGALPRTALRVHGARRRPRGGEPERLSPAGPQSNADTVIEQDMALVVELYAGESGGRDGVKLGDQIVVTSDGCPRPVSVPVLGGAPRMKGVAWRSA